MDSVSLSSWLYLHLESHVAIPDDNTYGYFFSSHVFLCLYYSHGLHFTNIDI